MTGEEVRRIPGFHAVREALLDPHTEVRELWLAAGRRPHRTEELLRLARERAIPVLVKPQEALSGLVPGMAHQGIVAMASGTPYAPFERLLALAQETGERALLLAADHITDEGNLGALIRTAAFFGAQGLLLPRDRSAGLGPRVLKSTAGACRHLPVAQVTNLGQALDSLESLGLWIIGAAGDGEQDLYAFDWKRGIVLVAGSEHKGLGHAVRKRCHALVRIPSRGPLEALNVSVAAGVILSEICRQRNTQPTRAEGHPPP